MLIEKWRPKTLDDIVLDNDTRLYFETAIAKKEIPHLLFCSAPGTGKTSLAKIIPILLDAQYRYINASDERGIDVIREKVTSFAQTKSLNGELKIIILDEVDGLTGDAQRSLRNVMEEYFDNVRFILTGNYKNRISTPLRSRVQTFELVPPLDGCIKRVVDIIKAEKIKVDKDQQQKLIDLIQSNYPDLRKTIGDIEKCTINGVLNIKFIKDVTEFAGKVIELIKQNKPINDIRKFVIHGELDFNNDYLCLLRGMYEYIYEKEQDETKKRDSMLTIGRFMESHSNVMDFEINAFCCIIQLLTILH